MAVTRTSPLGEQRASWSTWGEEIELCLCRGHSDNICVGKKEMHRSTAHYRHNLNHRQVSTWWVNKTHTANRGLNRAVISIQAVGTDLWTTRLQYLSRAVILWIIHGDHIWWAHVRPTINLFYLQRRGRSVVPAFHKNGIFTFSGFVEVTAPFG